METFFPIARAAQLSAAEVRAHLRRCFERWGLPKALRVDNGDPWATRSDIPSALALWLTGLGVRVILNRPRQSTDNGVVERDHGVLAGWVEPHKAQTLTQFQSQLDWAITVQRERYPIRAGRSRHQVYPELNQNPRRYTEAQEPRLWQLARVDAFLSPLVWTRRVDKVGRISIFSRAYSVGRAFTGRAVQVRFDPQPREWVIQSEQGQVLKRFPAQEITPPRILNLDIAKRANSVSPHSS